MANSDVVRSTYEAFNKKDMCSLASKLDPDCTWDFIGPEAIPFAGHYVGLSGVLHDYARIMMDSVDWQQFAPEEFVEHGDMVVVRGREECRVRRSGRNYAGEWVHVFKMKGGRILEAREYHDTAEVARAFD